MPIGRRLPELRAIRLIYIPAVRWPDSGTFFSEYIEGSSYNKALEIYNGTGSPVNLSDYQVMLFSNGASSASTTLTLSGVLDHNDVYTLAHSNADFALTSLADYINNGGVLNYNGDDALALYKVSTQSYVDIFGVIDDDPGDAWTAGDLSTVDKTLVRKPGVTEGITQNPIGTGSSAFTTLGTEWDSYAVDTFSYFGSHNLRQRSLSYIYQDLDVGNVQSFLFSGLDSDVQYFYVVRASNAYVSSDDSNEISVFTQSESTPPSRVAILKLQLPAMISVWNGRQKRCAPDCGYEYHETISVLLKWD